MDYTKYHYEALIKHLIVLSSDAATQIKACGMGHTEDELALDLVQIFNSGHRSEFLKQGYLTTEVDGLIAELDSILESKSDSQDESFWCAIDTHSDWEMLRIKARNILEIIGKGDYTIEIRVEEKTIWIDLIEPK